MNKAILAGAGGMDKETTKQFLLFNPKPTGEPVNSHVHRIPREREPDYIAMQRFVEKSAELISIKKQGE